MMRSIPFASLESRQRRRWRRFGQAQQWFDLMPHEQQLKLAQIDRAIGRTRFYWRFIAGLLLVLVVTVALTAGRIYYVVYMNS